MIQYIHAKIPNQTRWATYKDKMGGCSEYDNKVLDLIEDFNWTKDTLEMYINEGTLRECKKEEYLYVEEFSRFFGIFTQQKTSFTHKCDCDFTLLLQKGCQCGGI